MPFGPDHFWVRDTAGAHAPRPGYKTAASFKLINISQHVMLALK